MSEEEFKLAGPHERQIILQNGVEITPDVFLGRYETQGKLIVGNEVIELYNNYARPSAAYSDDVKRLVAGLAHPLLNNKIKAQIIQAIPKVEEMESKCKEKERQLERESKLLAEIYNDDGKIVPQRIATYLKEKYFFKAMKDNGDLYIFNGAYYKLGAEAVIEEECNLLLNDDAKTHTMSETIALIKYASYTDRTESDRNLLCFKNGLVNLETGELEEFDPELFVTRQLPLEFNPGLDCPAIKKFISEIVAEKDIPTIQEWIGYCLHPGYEVQKAALFIGEGGNGKSTLLALIREFLGAGNISAVSLQALDNNRFAVASLFGKMANLFPDLPDAALHRTGNFKMLTGGDMITAEKKFGQSFTFVNTTKLLFSCNKAPESMDQTSAFSRRLTPVTFPNKFEGEKDDKNLLKKLTTPEELSGLFNWAFEGLKRLLKNGDFTNAISSAEMQDYYSRISSPIAAFVKDQVESGTPYKIDSAGIVLKAPFYKDFVEYCNENRLPACASNIFGKDLPRYLPSIIAGKTREFGDGQQPCWRGISFTVNNQEEKEEPQKKLQ